MRPQAIVLALAVLSALLPPSAVGQVPYLVKDINQRPQASGPREIIDVGGIAYFSATKGAIGRELWRSDGTEAGTFLVKDICPGACSSMPYRLTPVGSIFFFFLNDDADRDISVWRSDGTEAGTFKVADPTGSAWDPEIIQFGSSAVFNAGPELWLSDGTPAGTFVLHDFDPTGYFAEEPRHLAVAGGVLYFSAGITATRAELWKSDGTPAGTVPIADINPTGGSAPLALTALGNLVYFVADDGVTGRELWKSDGTSAGTVRVADVCPGACHAFDSRYVSLRALGSTLYFQASTPALGLELWRTDGTSAGTSLVADICPDLARRATSRRASSSTSTASCCSVPSTATPGACGAAMGRPRARESFARPNARVSPPAGCWGWTEP